MSITLANGITLGAGVTLGAGGAGPVPGINNVTGYSEMAPPVIPSSQLQDPTATVNGSVGFTINDDSNTGVAIIALTISNQNWLANNFVTVPGTYTCSWGPGSTVASSSIFVVQTSPDLVFFIQGQSGPATYNYPFTFS